MVNTHIFGKTKKKSKHLIGFKGRTGRMARFLVKASAADYKLTVRPATHIKTGNITGKGRKFVPRYIIVVDAVQLDSVDDLTNTKYYLTETIKDGGSTIHYGLKLISNDDFKTNQTMVKKLFKKLKDEDKENFFKYLVHIHFKATPPIQSKKIVFLLNSTLIDGLYGSSVEYDKIMPFHYATKEDLKGVESKSDIKKKLDSLFHSESRAYLRATPAIKTEYNSVHSFFGTPIRNSSGKIMRNPNGTIMRNLTQTKMTYPSGTQRKTSNGTIMTHPNGSIQVFPDGTPMGFQDRLEYGRYKAKIATGRANMIKGVRTGNLKKVLDEYKEKEAKRLVNEAADTHAAQATANQAVANAKLAAERATALAKQQVAHLKRLETQKTSAKNLKNAKIKLKATETALAAARNELKLLKNTAAVAAANAAAAAATPIATSHILTTITTPITTSSNAASPNTVSPVVPAAATGAAGAAASTNPSPSLNLSAPVFEPSAAAHADEPETGAGAGARPNQGGGNPTYRVTQNMFVFTNSDKVRQDLQAKIGYYPNRTKYDNDHIYGDNRNDKVYVVFTNDDIPRSFALLEYYLTMAFKYIKKPATGGSKKINYKQVAGGLKELYTTNPMAAKAKTRKMIKLLKNMQS